jgi:hypothetical protein
MKNALGSKYLVRTFVTYAPRTTCKKKKRTACLRISPCRDADYSGRLRLPCRDAEKQKYVLFILRHYFVPIAHVCIIYQRITLLRWEWGFALSIS